MWPLDLESNFVIRVVLAIERDGSGSHIVASWKAPQDLSMRRKSSSAQACELAENCCPVVVGDNRIAVREAADKSRRNSGRGRGVDQVPSR